MNVLFANYGDFATNSTNHIAGFANALAGAGHACVVAVPWGADTVRLVPQVHFQARSFRDCLERGPGFPDGRPADIVHAWTPREVVREFVLRYVARSQARLVVHLEDNEDHLFSAATGLPVDDLPSLDERAVRERLTSGLTHPRRSRLLLRAAEGASVIVPTLRAFVPAGKPVLDLPPGVDFQLFRPTPRHPERRASLGFRNGEKCIVYTGSTSFANADETRDLYAAVLLLNRRGVPTRLIRTGADAPEFSRTLPPDVHPFVQHLGFVPRTELPHLLAEADVLVQPGRPGTFNDFRLPSKLPEYLAAGRPVVVPASNIGLDLVHEREALVLPEATPERIADACERIFRDPELGARLAEHATAFARTRFDGASHAQRLAAFYESILAGPPGRGTADVESELTLALQGLSSDLSAPDREAVDLLLPIVRDFEHATGNHPELSRLEQERDEWRTHFEQAREHAANLSRRNAELTHDLDDLKIAHARQLDRLHQAVAQRDEKIARMLASLSWKLTMPVRAIRRCLVRDPQNSHHDPATPPDADASIRAPKNR